MGGDGAADRPAAAARPPRRSGRRPVRAGAAAAAARAVPRAARAGAVPVRPPGGSAARATRRHAGRWPRSSGSTRARSCGTASAPCCSRTRRWTGAAAVGRDPSRLRDGERPRRQRASASGRTASGPVVAARSAATAELARLASCSSGHRALTLTGPAARARHASRSSSPPAATSPVWYVDFSPIDDPALVAPTRRGGGGRDPRARATIRSRVDRRHARRSAGACWCSTRASTSSAPRASSRRRAAGRRPACGCWRPAGGRSGLSGEFAWPVPPLGLPPPDAASAARSPSHAAVRAVHRAGHGGATGPRDRRRGRRRHRRDLPRARRASAGHRARRRPHRAAQPCGDPGAARRTGSSCSSTAAPTPPQRQQTLRAAIDWSFELLTAEQRTFFARLGVFAGTFDLDAALAVAGAGLDASAGAARRRWSSSRWSTRAGADRYRLLDTLRAYALDVLAELDADDTRDRHADVLHRARRAGRAGDPRPRPAGVARPVPQRRQQLPGRARVVAAHRRRRPRRSPGRCVGLVLDAQRHAHRGASSTWNDSSPSRTSPAPIRAKCLWGYALLAASLGRLETARDAGYLAAELGRSAAATTAGTAYGLNAAAVAEWALGNHDRSLDAHREAIELLDQIEDQWGLAVCKVLQARTLFDLGDPTPPGCADEGVDHARRAGDLHVLGIALTQIAQIAIADGDHAAARRGRQRRRSSSKSASATRRGRSRPCTCSATPTAWPATSTPPATFTGGPSHSPSRIGHAAAMCEAMEDLARAEAAEHPDLARRAARAPRAPSGTPRVCRCANATPRSSPTSQDARRRMPHPVARPLVRVTGRGADVDDRQIDH